MIDYYSILNVAETATQEEIKKQFRKLTLQYHPDKNEGDKSAEEKFKKVAEAYDILGDPEKRSAYDISKNKKSNSDFGSHVWYRTTDFGGMRSTDHLNILVKRTVKLEDALSGTELTIEVEKVKVDELTGIGQTVKVDVTLPINIRTKQYPISIQTYEGEERFVMRFVHRNNGNEEMYYGKKFNGNLIVEVKIEMSSSVWLDGEGNVNHEVDVDLFSLLTGEPVTVNSVLSETFNVKNYDNSNVGKIKFTIYNRGIAMGTGATKYIFHVKPKSISISKLRVDELETLKSLLKQCEK